jgi:hypothetical protein
MEGTSSELDVVDEIELFPSELRRVPKGTDKETARNGDSRCTCGSITRFYRVDALRNRKAFPRPFQRRR